MHCAPPSKRHALCNANGRSWGLRGAAIPDPAPRRSDLCAYPPPPASNNPVTNNNANASFLDMPRAHTRIRISTPHVGVLITFIGACAPSFRHRKRAATNQRLSAVRGCKPLRGPGIAASGVMPNSARRQAHCLGSKLRQLRRAQQPAAAPTAMGPTTRRSAKPRPAQQPAAAPTGEREQQAMKEGSE